MYLAVLSVAQVRFPAMAHLSLTDHTSCLTQTGYRLKARSIAETVLENEWRPLVKNCFQF